MRRTCPALVLLAAALLASARVGATTAADIPCDDPDPTVPCVFSGSLTVAPGSTLDFGTRAFSIGPSGILTAGEGNSLTIKAPAVRLQAGALLCTAPASGVGANVTIETTGDILLERSGPIRARIDLSAATTGGQLTLTAGGSVNSAGDLLVKGTPGDAGSISISAVGAVTLAGEVHLEAGIDGLGGDLTVSAGGAIAASGALVDSSGGLKGGSIDLEAGGDLSTGGKLDVSGNGAGSDGGFLVLNANGAITVGGRIAADGSGSPDFGGFGGDVSVSAGGNIQLNEQINAAGGAPDGEGGAIDLSAGLNIVQTQQILALGIGSDAFGGTVFATAGGLLSLGALIDLHGGSNGGGGFLGAQAGREVRALAEVDADGDGGGVLLSTAVDALAGAVVAGPVTVGGNLHAGGDLLGGQMAVEACDVDLAAGAVFASSGAQARNVFRASGQMTIDGALSALPAGTNQLTYRDPARPPLVGADAVITPTAVANVDSSLPPCGAVCGNGIVELGEQCDDGATNGTPGAACDSRCQIGVFCGSGAPATCVPCADDTNCHPLGRCGGFACLAGLCTAVTPLACDDGNPCTQDSCDAVEGCVHAPLAGAGIAGCDDENVCNGVETCAGGACVAGVPPPGDDGDLCTDDGVCDPVRGYLHTPLIGFPSVTCRFDTLDAALSGAATGDISSGLRKSLTRVLGKARAQVERAAGAHGKRQDKMLKGAGKQLGALGRLLATARQKKQVAPALGGRLGDAVAGASGALSSLHAAGGP
ncbi:MAG: hypothetical protein E6J76_07140 [Deltaproteobacteria bacterium]|nr:MAG: hypothetical protein E6J76_07140 [Deltaproteobacteria bacterium]